MFDVKAFQEGIKSQAKEAVNGLYSLIKKVKIYASYTGGNPQIEETASGTDGEEVVVLASFAIAPPVASDDAMVATLSNGQRVLLGKPVTLPSGILTDDDYWWVPSAMPTVETTVSTQTAALRVHAPCTINITTCYVRITTAQASAKARVRIYGSNGAGLVWDSGDIAASATGNIAPTVLPTPARIFAGFFYVILVTVDTAGVAFQATDTSAAAPAFLNSGTTQRGTNETLGSATTAEFPWVLFKT
jgi:hypothetical protein